ncbi:hypothetical protein KL86DPRO_10427 [uncultured delta proteobacterium]|uniref:Uncharacterized protein n=1 Tax=uncultured delta proteobacterium TaxID=34034 RepID=A0A212J069_9DELT|nr:hypothetical protein KL86DPRO_10427 [uncultured delta proteobacterium]
MKSSPGGGGGDRTHGLKLAKLAALRDRSSSKALLAPLRERLTPFLRTCTHGGGGGDRTHDIQLAKLALSQLSYTP